MESKNKNMGGHALKNTYTKRVNETELLSIYEVVKNKLSKYFDKIEIPLYYRNKESFGDLDLVCINNNNLDIKQIIINTFAPNEIHINSNVYSFDYKELQIDLIFTSNDRYDIYYNYLCWNDLNGLIGKIAHKFNLKWGVDGLKYVIYNDYNNELGTIYLTSDVKQGLTFLGFDYSIYKKGFDTLEQIYDFIIKSKYFSPNIFSHSNINRKTKEHIAKRPVYNEFIKYIKDIQFEENKISDPDYLSLIKKEFVFFEDEYNKIMDNIALKEQIKNKFNGNIVLDYYKSKNINLDGITLGNYLSKFKNSITDYNDYILNTDIETILNYFFKLNKNG